LDKKAERSINIFPHHTMQVFLLGNFRMQHGGELLTLPDTSDARHLLAYLLLKKQQMHARSVLLGVFWLEMSEPRARRALSQAIWHIRRRFPDLLESTTESVGISPRVEIWIDVDVFKALTEKRLGGNALEVHRDLDRAIQLYQADLLEGLYEDWVLLEREYLRERYLQALEHLIQIEKSEGNYQRALELTLRLVDADALRESAHREIMQLYYLLNRPNAAIKQFETYSQLLLDELGLEPEPETVALAREILHKSEESLPPHLPKVVSESKLTSLERKHSMSMMLIGRERERTLLIRYIENIFKGYGGVILIEGEAGIGKTRLIREISRDAEWRGAQILWGYGVEGETSPAFALLMNAIDEKLTGLRVMQLAELVKPLHLQVLKSFIPKIATYLSELSPAPPLEPEQEESRLAEAFLALISKWSEIVPLVLIFEDLHWADEDSLKLLPLLTFRLRNRGLLIIGTYRGEEARASRKVWEQIQAIDNAGVLERLELPALTAEPSSELIRRCLGLNRTAPAFEKRIFRETNGNPLFIMETLRTLQEEGYLSQDEKGNWQTPWDETTVDYEELPLPPIVEAVIARRFAYLSFPARQVLNAASVLDIQLDYILLSSVSNLKPKSFLKATRELVNHHIFEEISNGYRFSHDKIRQVARAELNAEQLVTLHQQVVKIVEKSTPEKLELLAYHATKGHLWKKALNYHQQAAIEAEKHFAFASALAHYDQITKILDFVDLSASLAFDIHSTREKILEILGKRELQETELGVMQTLADDDPDRLYLVYLRKAKHLAKTSAFDQSKELANRALLIAREQSDKHKEADTLHVLGESFIFQGKTEESIQYLHQAVKFAEHLGDIQSEIKYRCSLSSALTGIREYDAAEKELMLALKQAVTQSNLLEQTEIFNLLGIIRMERGESSQAQDYYEQSLSLSREIGFLYGEGRALVNLGNLYYFQGKIGRTLELYDQAIEIFQSFGEKRGEVQIRLNRASISLNVLGGSPQVEEDALFALDYAERVDDPLSKGQALTVLAEAERQHGDLVNARKHLEEGIEVMEKAGDRWLLVQEYRTLGELDIEERKPTQALINLERALSICKELGMTNLEAPITALKGVALLGEGKLGEALDATDAAMQLVKQDVEKVYLIPYWHARVLRAAGKQEEANQAIQEAYKLLQQALSSLSPELREKSLRQIPEHRDILELWQQTQPRQIFIHLPKAGGNSGEMVNIRWTIESPEDLLIENKVARRRHRIQRLLNEAKEQDSIPTNQALADALGVGLRTIERDIAMMKR